MDDPDEARALIDEFRRSKGVDDVDGDNENASDLLHALRLLSEELYSTPTHFILELLQNCDDNRYDAEVIPRLSIVYRTDGYLWLGCNEVGFTAANVRAICRIGRSTKKVEGAQKGYIGEKGIGFKSVFKVANVVWISSRALQFQFDKTKPLGMIAPLWCEFNANSLVQETSMFCFQIPDSALRQVVQDDLLDLQPELLLFLRQLRSIEVKIQTPSGEIEKSFCLNRSDAEHSGLKLTTLFRSTVAEVITNMETRKFLVTQRIAENMPKEARRENVSQSEVIIAFPITDSFEPDLRNSMTYNFLPIRAYGLSFVLQGDFMLSANREDVLQGNDWNKAIISAALDLFLQSVRLFNSEGVMMYTWPRYLQSQGNAFGTAFQSVLSRLVADVRKTPTLESSSGTMETPLSLEYVPEVYTDGGSNPEPLLVGMRQSAARSYSEEDLTILGLPKLTGAGFIALVKRFVTEEHAVFVTKSAAWHCRLAKGIMSAGVKSEEIRDLKLIPLQTGQWVSGSAKKLFFPHIEGGEDITLPPGINVNVIAEHASKDRVRSKMFSQLGARNSSAAQVYSLIVEQHQNHGSKYSGWTVDIVVAHAWFLFTSPSQPSKCDISRLLLASQSSSMLHHGGELYMDTPESRQHIRKFFGDYSGLVLYIHERYLTYANEVDPGRSGAWIEWLQEKLGLQTRPKLSRLGKISPEFQFIITNSPGNSWLILLKMQWQHYQKEISRDDSLRDALSKVNVKCVDGKLVPVKDVYLGSPSIIKESLHAFGPPILDVEDPNDETWLHFHMLGLKTHPDLRFYLGIVKSLPTIPGRKNLLKDAQRVYEGIYRHIKESPALVVKTFETEKVVFADSSPSGQWLKLSDCRWESMSCLRDVVSLKPWYGSLQDFFVGKLALKDATGRDIMAELARRSNQPAQIPSIKDLLLALSSCVGTKLWDEKDNIASNVARLKVIPVTGPTNPLVSCFDDWFIADKEDYEQCFKGKVALLDFKDEEVAKVLPLLSKLLHRQRTLSNAVKFRYVPVGEPKFHPSFTERLRSKAFYLSRLCELPKRETVLIQLQKINVHTCAEIQLRRYVVIRNREVFGNDDKGWIYVQETEGSIDVFIPTECAATNTLPVGPLNTTLRPKLDIPRSKGGLFVTILVTDNVEVIRQSMEVEGIHIPRPMPQKPKVEVQDLTALTSNGSPTEPPSVVKPTAAPGNDVNGSSMRGAETPDAPSGSNGHATRSTAPDLRSEASLTASAEHPIRAVPRASPVISSLATFLPERTGASLLSFASREDDEVPSQRPRRRPAMDQRAASSFEDTLPGILNAASTYDFIDVNFTAASSANRVRPGAATSSAQGQETVNSGHWPTLNESASDMPRRRSPVNGSGTSNGAAGSGAAPTVRPNFTRGEPTEFQDNVGYGGEVFVYKLLKRICSIGQESWTSNLRERFGLEPFDDDESAFADFTIMDPTASARVTEWLISIGYAAASNLSGTHVNHHFEVKTTNGNCNEPFTLSSNQLSLAQAWNESVSDVCVILRVYNLRSSPRFHAFIDPIALVNAGELEYSPHSYVFKQR